MNSKNYSLKKNKNGSTYSLKIHGEYNDVLYSVLVELLPNSFYDEESKSVFFVAEHVQKLSSFLLESQMKISVKSCINMIDTLSHEIILLKKIEYGFYGLDLDDMLVIDNNIFINCSCNYLLPLVEDHLFFYGPFDIPFFGNPEINEVKNLPYVIPFESFYYSLGVLVVFCLFNNYLLVGNEIKSEEEICEILSPLYNTKLYGFLKRCFNGKSEKRTLLLI